MEQILQVLHRFTALLEQYDGAEQNIAQMEMQNEVLLRLPGEYDKELGSAKTQTSKNVKLFKAMKDAAERAIFSITGLIPGDLRTKVADLKVTLERAGELSLEEKRYRRAFEILAESDGFGQDQGDTRADYEAHLSSLKKQTQTAMSQLVALINNSINKNPIVTATDSVLSQLQGSGVINVP